MTLNLPLLYVLWLEEYCQISPNKNKSPNLWHVTSIWFSPDKILQNEAFWITLEWSYYVLIYYIVSAWKEWFLLSNRDFFAAVPLLNPLDDPKCERTKMSVPRTPGRWLAISSVMWLPKWTFVQQIQRYMRHEYSQIGRID